LEKTENQSEAQMNVTGNAMKLPYRLSGLLSRMLVNRWLPLLVFVTGASTTALYWMHANKSITTGHQAGFDLKSRLVVNSIKHHLVSYEQVLRGVQGMFAASDAVTPAQFRDYVASLRIDESYPEIQGVGFAAVRNPADREADIPVFRISGSRVEIGSSAEERRLVSSIIYIEPSSGKNLRAVGYDMYSDPVRRDAMNRARETDGAALSGKINLEIETDRKVQSGNLMFLPVYARGFKHDTPASRRKHIVGWIFAPLRMNELISSLLTEHHADMAVSISDVQKNSAETLLFESDENLEYGRSGSNLTQTANIDFGGRTWAFKFRSRPAQDKHRNISNPSVIAATGTVSSLLLAILIWQLATGRSRAVQQAAEIMAELKTSELRLLTVFEQIPNIAVQGYDSDRRVIFWNGASEKLYGFTREEAMERRIEDLVIPGNMVNMVVSAITDWVENDVPIPASEYVMQRKDGSPIHVFSSKVMQFNSKREPEIFCIDVELTELKWAEQELLELAAQLTQEISERKLAQKELFVKQIQLERVNDTLSERIKHKVEELRRNDQILISQNRQAAMGEMISNIAHQWRQPLNTIGLIIQYLQRTCSSDKMDAEELRKEFSNALSIVMHMSKTIDDFRNFFSPNKSKQLFEISRAISQTLEFSSADLNKHGIKVELEVEEGITVVGFRNEYSQVLLNILNNARDQLIEVGRVDPRIDIRTFVDNGVSVTTVHDNGGGIPDDVIDRVFDPYFTTKVQGKGTGIGLYMSKMIIEKHMGGSLKVANRNGGAEFRIEV